MLGTGLGQSLRLIALNIDGFKRKTIQFKYSLMNTTNQYSEITKIKNREPIGVLYFKSDLYNIIYMYSTGVYEVESKVEKAVDMW